MLRIGPFFGLPAALRSLGECPENVLLGSGFDLSLFSDPDGQISFKARSELFAHCAAKTRCPQFGLLAGQYFELRFLGVLGLLVKYSPDVGAALDCLVRFQRSQVVGAEIALLVDQSKTVLSYEIHDRATRGTEHIEDAVLAALCNIMRTLCGAHWKPVEVRFTHRKPASTEPFSQFFKCPVVFSAEQSALVFSSNWLSSLLDKHDADLLKLLRKQLEAYAPQYADDFVGHVRSLLRMAVLSGNARTENLAKQLSIHVRTMNRRLLAAGTSFQKLLDQTRFELARRMLKNSRLTVCQIADSLGYADSRAFTRAFRRWSGVSPGQWRKRLREGSPANSSRSLPVALEARYSGC